MTCFHRLGLIFFFSFLFFFTTCVMLKKNSDKRPPKKLEGFPQKCVGFFVVVVVFIVCVVRRRRRKKSSLFLHLPLICFHFLLFHDVFVNERRVRYRKSVKKKILFFFSGYFDACFCNQIIFTRKKGGKYCYFFKNFTTCQKCVRNLQCWR